MKILSIVGIIIILITPCFAQKRSHVILISIDGFRPEFYLDSTWPAPNIQSLLREGVHANRMLSVFPSFTYPAHVAMVTGAFPARSGIFYNRPLESTGNWSWFLSEIKVNHIWRMSKKAGLKTAAVQWPVSVGNDITYNIPEIWNPLHPSDRITESRKYSTPDLISEIEENATGVLDSLAMNERFSTLDDNSGRISAYILRKYFPDLLAVHFAGVDGKQHEFGRDHEQVKIALSNVDNAIGRILEEIEICKKWDSTTVIIVGDHGFCNISNVLRPNVWVKGINAKFHAAGGSTFLYPINIGDTAQIASKVLQAIEALPLSYKSKFRIIDRKTLNEMGVDSSVILALAGIPGAVFSNTIEGDQMQLVNGGHHGYDPNLPQMYTGFIIKGAMVKKNAHIIELCVTDIAPLIAKLLGIKGTFPDGKLKSGILIKQ